MSHSLQQGPGFRAVVDQVGPLVLEDLMQFFHQVAGDAHDQLSYIDCLHL